MKRWPSHLITDHGIQFTAEEFGIWCRRRGIQQRFGAIGKYGSVAVIERFICSMKNECTRLLPIVPLARAAFARELDHYVAWYNAERPHALVRGRPGIVVELAVEQFGGRKHLPIVSLKRVA